MEVYLWANGLRNYLKEVFDIEILHIRTIGLDSYRITTNHFMYSNWREEATLLCVPANIHIEWEYVTPPQGEPALEGDA